MFIHLHNHSDYSLLDGACRLEGLVQTAVEQKAPAIALTDHGNMFGALEFYSRARAAGIKPIIGCEFYVAPNSRLEKRPGPSGEQRYHLVLLAKDYTGYQNLVKLSSEGYLTGFYYKPRIDKELLSEYHEGLICMSGCINGEIPQILLSGNMKKARKEAQFYKKLFGDDYYLEIQRHNIDDEEQVLPLMAELAHELSLKLVATNDAHYLKREHASVHNVLLCVGTQTNINNPKRFRFKGEEFYLKTPEEMAELFAEYPEALSVTAEIAEKCSLEIKLGERHFPMYTIPDPKLTADEYLAKIAREGLKDRFNEDLTEDARERLEYELQVIEQTGFANYFLITADFVQWAKEHDIPVGPGRGSAAGCLVSYCLGITNLNPLKYNLLFERFLNPERVSPPDIDIDFSDDRREEVISYVREKYGEDSVCRITTFGTMMARSAVRDVARALGMSYADGDKIARLIPESSRDITIAKCLTEVPDLKRLIDSDPRFKELIDHALIIEGTVRNSGKHAAGVVICPGSTVDFIPVYKQGDDNEVYTQYDMNWIDRLGLLKMDFLGLQTLQEIDLTLKTLAKRGIQLDFYAKNEEYDDPETYRLFSEGDTVGVFQFESGGMRDNLMRLKPERLEDLIAMNALYRPGPMQMIPDFIDRKHGRKKVSYLHPKLETILKNTYGVIVYQEQVMSIATDLAGFSLGKADIFRKAIGKKKADLMKTMEKDFIDGCVENGIKLGIARKIFELIAKFARYGFPKAHSTGYAIIAYQCAFLKRHYPAEYMASCLTVRGGSSEQVMKLLTNCQAHNIQILAPDINESEDKFVTADSRIRFGMTAIKNVGDAAVQAIMQARSKVGSFSSLHHFLTSVDLRVINKRVAESLIDAGAFDALGPNRATLLASLPSAVAFAQAIHDERIRGQTTLFGSSGDTTEDGVINLMPPELHYMDELPDGELQSREKVVLGYYISSHPLERFRRETEDFSTHKLIDKDGFKDDLKIRICVVLSSVRTMQTRKGDPMAILKVEDLTGSIEGLVFPQIYEKFSDFLISDNLVGLSGHISRQDKSEEPKLKVEEVVDLEHAVEAWGKALHIKLSSDRVTQPLVDRLGRVFGDNPGNCSLYIDLAYPTGDVKSLKVDRFRVQPAPELIQRLTELLGEDQISLSIKQ